MVRLTSIKADVSKLKHQITETAKGTRVIQFPIDQFYEGTKGIYLDLMGEVNDEVDQYGNNGGIWLGQTKEQRDNKENKLYLGNTKVIWSGESTPKGNNSSTPPPSNNSSQASDDDDLPF
jgi:hypothetical protein